MSPLTAARLEQTLAVSCHFQKRSCVYYFNLFSGVIKTHEHGANGYGQEVK